MRVATVPCPPSPVHPLTARASGFTLIEVLVVLVILGVIVSIATVAIGVLGRDREVEEQARRIWAVVAQGREEAALQGRDLGLFLERESYEFMRFDARQFRWENVDDDDFLARRVLPPGISMRLWLESREVVLGPQPTSRLAEGAVRAPHIVMLASGEIVPFRLALSREGTDVTWQLLSQPDQSVIVEAADDS